MEELDEEFRIWQAEAAINPELEGAGSHRGKAGPSVTFKATPAMKDTVKAYKAELQDVYDEIKRKGKSVAQHFMSNSVQHQKGGVFGSQNQAISRMDFESGVQALRI